MKKIIAVLTALLLLGAVFCSWPALAAGKPTFEVSSVKAARDEGAKVTISIKNNPGITSAKLKVNFDTALTLKSVKYGEKFVDNGMLPQKKNLNTPPVTLNWVLGLSEFSGDGVFATLTFAAGSKAKVGDYKISLSYNPNDVFNLKEENIKFETVDGIFTVTGDPEAVITADGTKTTDGSKASGSTVSAEPGHPDGNGDYVGGEVLFDEDGNDITPAPDAQNKDKNNLVVWLCVAAAVLIAAAGTVVVIAKKKGKKEPETSETEE